MHVSVSKDDVGRMLPFVGRAPELAQLLRLLDPHRTTGDSLVVVGDAGVGKSRLLDAAVEAGQRAGWTVLQSRGGRSETELAFAGLHQLVRGVLDRSDQLPEGQRSALHTALGLESKEDEPTPLRVGVALLSLLSAVAAEKPLLLVIDDAQWVDSASLEALAFVARRATEEPIVLLAGARGVAPPRSLEPLPRLRLGLFDTRSSIELLDSLPMTLRGADRRMVLSQAAGNPLALIELARVAATAPSAALRWAAAPLPLTDRLYEVYGASLADLPAGTRRALLLAAVADAGDGTVSQVATAQVPPDDWLPAVDAGLVNIDDVIRFRHPLVRAAVYRAASMSERRDTHQIVADLLVDYPDRRAWHLAATSVAPNEGVAADLENSAVRSARRGAYMEAGRALERAAELSADTESRARRLVQATDAAINAGDSAWVRELVARVRESTQDPALLRVSAHMGAVAVATTLDHDGAMHALRSAIRPSLTEDPMLALASLTTGAIVAQFTGDEAIRQEIVAYLATLDSSLEGDPVNALPIIAAARMWILASVARIGDRDDLIADLNRQTQDEITDPDAAMMLGAAATVLDETDAAVRLLTNAADRARLRPTGHVSAATLTCLAWVAFERGRWDEALSISSEGAQIAIAGRQEMYLVSADSIEATIAALRGDVLLARMRISEVMGKLDMEVTTGISSRIRTAAAFVAQAEGDHALAFHELSRLFYADGTPTHYQRSWYVLADIAASGVRSGATQQARAVVEKALSHLTGPLRPRMLLQVNRAHALLAETDASAEEFFSAAVVGTNMHVPFELAQARLDFGEWLRRRRRVIEARTMLEAARQEFERLGARPMLARTMNELRATGIRQEERGPDLFGQLTPQQQRIARLAASGLTNREIGERLFLSPRTVSTHLYAVFPVLQITARAQLHDAVPPEGGSD